MERNFTLISGGAQRPSLKAMLILSRARSEAPKTNRCGGAAQATEVTGVTMDALQTFNNPDQKEMRIKRSIDVLSTYAEKVLRAMGISARISRSKSRR
jgi:hypothetical protein